MADAPRRFSDRQRAALYLTQDGHCADCGCKLTARWHADHVIPYSAGGDTDVINGQALCPDCNLRKGARMQRLPQWTYQLRQWQELAYREYLSEDYRDFLLVATPGAGKTLFALRTAHALIQNGTVDRLVVVCPTRHLKEQWTEKAAPIGIHLDPKWGNDRLEAEAADYHGVCVTYHQVAMSPDIHRIHCARRSTVVVFDEIHHAGDQLTWGNSITHAFEPATRRLSISGTPFRTDNNPIPFVTYDDNGMSVANFEYGYGNALRDSVCRQLVFPSYDGHMEWLHCDQYVTASFQDALALDQANQRLNTALYHKGDWIRDVFKAANDHLQRIRVTTPHTNAGGLVIARDQDHARRLADVMERISGTIPEVAVSDDPDASAVIKRFTESAAPWLIAVKMVSEGVDIPRLRVGVYATNVTTELYFRQAVGRFVRWIDWLEDQCAYVYFPKDERFVAYVQQIKAEVRHHLMGDDGDDDMQRELSGTRSQLSLYVPIVSTSQEAEVFYDHQKYDPHKIAQAREVIHTLGMQIDPAQLLRAYNLLGGTELVEVQTPVARTTTLADEKAHLRKRINGMVNELVYGTDAGIDQRMVNGWCKRQDGHELRDCTVDELRRRIVWLQEWLRNPRPR
jgi:superfamily II DNA or RNA helicase